MRRFYFLFFLALASPVLFPSNCEPATNPYDIRHYDLLIEPDFEALRLSLTCTIRIDNPSLEKSFAFGLNDRYESVHVTSGASPVAVQRQNGSILLNIDRPARNLELTFKLEGSLGQSQDEERNVIDRDSLFLLWSDRFYPIDFSDWASATTNILLPQGFQVIAPGRLRRVEQTKAKIQYTFETPGPEVNYSVFADAHWIKTEREINGIRMQTLLHPESQQFAEQIFKTSSGVLKFYSETFCPYPFGQFSFVTIKGMYARRAFSGFVGYEPDYLKREFLSTGHDAHETALLWWGHTIRGSGRGSSQWLEGFGDYSEILYDEKFHKPIPNIFHSFREKYLKSSPESDLLYSELRGSTDQALIHGRYPWLFHLIRYVVGDRRFGQAMHLLFKRHRFSVLSMDEFVSTLEEGSHSSLAWFRHEWLERKGVPIIAMTSKIEKAGNGFRVICRLEQRGNIYHLPLQIGIETRGAMRVRNIFLKEQQSEFILRSTTKPTGIYLDPYDRVLMKKVAN
jgi:hypothetical protein